MDSAISSLERIKRDFVVNASHELRTPLTAIRGYAETLEEEEGDTHRREYAGTIRRHADRLARLVEDLLALAELEERGPRVEREPLDLGELAVSTAALFEGAARAKGLELVVVSVQDDLEAAGDRRAGRPETVRSSLEPPTCADLVSRDGSLSVPAPVSIYPSGTVKEKTSPGLHHEQIGRPPRASRRTFPREVSGIGTGSPSGGTTR